MPSRIINFNEPHISGSETLHLSGALGNKKFSGGGEYSRRVESYFENHLGSERCFFTSSCTDALEMCSLILGIGPGDEVIVPSYTFVSSALAFARAGADIRFVDSNYNHPNIDVSSITSLITPKTKAIVVVHYGGMSCDLDALNEIAKKENVPIIEDAAHSIQSFFEPRIKSTRIPLGSYGSMSTFSFHETKNIQCGEGGMLCINDKRLISKAEMIFEKGTNRSKFFRGQVDKYNWVETGSSFLGSEISAAFLWAQLEDIEKIQDKRKQIVLWYRNNWKELGIPIKYLNEPKYASNNGHLFAILCNSLRERSQLIEFLDKNRVKAVFHYQSLHKSPYAISKNWNIQSLPNADYFTDCLLRLPLHTNLSFHDVKKVCELIRDFYN